MLRGKTGSHLGTFNSPNSISICFSSKSHYLYSGCEDKKVRIWDLKRRQLYSTLDLDSPVQCVSVNRNDTFLACGLRSGKLVLRAVGGVNDFKSTPPLVLQQKITSPMSSVCFSPSKSKILAALNERGDINVWDTSKEMTVATFQGQHTAPAKIIAFSPVNRSMLVSAGLDKVEYWVLVIFQVTLS